MEALQSGFGASTSKQADKFKSSLELMYAQQAQLHASQNGQTNKSIGTTSKGDELVVVMEATQTPKPPADQRKSSQVRKNLGAAAVRQPVKLNPKSTATATTTVSSGNKVVSSGTTKASSQPMSKQGSGVKEPPVQAKSRMQTVSRDGSLKKPAAPAAANRFPSSAAKPPATVSGFQNSPADKPKKKLLFAK